MLKIILMQTCDASFSRDPRFRLPTPRRDHKYLWSLTYILCAFDEVVDFNHVLRILVCSPPAVKAGAATKFTVDRQIKQAPLKKVEGFLC